MLWSARMFETSPARYVSGGPDSCAAGNESGCGPEVPRVAPLTWLGNAWRPEKCASPCGPDKLTYGAGSVALRLVSNGSGGGAGTAAMSEGLRPDALVCDSTMYPEPPECGGVIDSCDDDG